MARAARQSWVGWHDALAPDHGMCRLCGSTVDQRDCWRETYAGTGQSLRRCGRCAGVYLAPDFTVDGLRRFYADAYRHLYPAEMPWRSGERFFAWRGDRSIARLRVARIAPLLPANGRLFEMGSGFGGFLGALAAARPDAQLSAAEPDHANRGALLQGAEVAFLADLDAVADGSLDAVAAFHVLEHLPDPKGFLVAVGRVLKPGGRAWIEVPDLMSDWRSRSFVHPAHLSYFTARTLVRLAEAAGLRVGYCSTHPAGGVLADYLWAELERADGPRRLAPVAAAPAAEIRMVDNRVDAVGWGWRDRVRSVGKRWALGLLGPGPIGELQRWRHHGRVGASGSPAVFADFLAALRAGYGEEAAAARHEIYFLCARDAGAGTRVRAGLAALRDAAWCAMFPARPEAPPAVAAVVTLAGPSGFDSLAPFLERLARRGVDSAVLRHPRARRRVAGRLPGRPPGAAWRHALAAFHEPFPDVGDAMIPAWIVRCCLFRLRLWRGAWERALAGGTGTLLLHNDFDLCSVAAIEAGRGRWRSVCVQHGLPTDEFFPARADRQIVWGESSAAVYRARGVPAAALSCGGLRQVPAIPTADAVPQEICLVSQTHTPVFGRPLGRDFLDLAQRLADHFAGRLPVAVLLHPEEARAGHPYRSAALAALCRRPPHRMLQDGARPALVVGFCSTALIEAAGRGHLVVGMDWPVPAGAAALAVGRPPRTAGNAEALLILLDQLLTDPAARRALWDEQAAWLRWTFSPAQDWLTDLGSAS